MPRIDPSQLLNTLSVLLAPNGGIRSAGEVPRIVQLMQKFSKKLVSKCIYVHILCSSSQDLLEAFLNQKGWDLLNAWFEDAYQSQNYHLCGDLIKLFSLCPMTPARLKENVEINQAPKLVRQLSCDTNVEPAVREAAQKVLQQWMSVIRSPASSQPVKDGSTKSKSKVSSKRALSASNIERSQSDESSSENEAQLDFDNSKDYNPNEDSDNDTNQGKRKKFKREDSTDIDDLLSSDDEDDEDDALTKFYKKRDEQKKREEERRKEKVKRKEEEKNSKSYSKTEIRDKLKSPQKERIKEIAKRMKEESRAQSNQIASLGKIPKLPKSDVDKKNISPSFGDLLGGLDSMKSKPKAAPIKNKNKDLLDSLDSSSPLKPKPRSDSKSDKHRSEKPEKEKERSRDRDRERHKSRDKERSRDKDRDHHRERKDSHSKSSDGSKHSKSDKDRPKPKLVIPEKRSHKDSGAPSPKEELKKSPKVIKESNFLGDILGDIMKEPPKKKKRRPSDVKLTENNVKELAEKAKAETEKTETPPESEKENTPSESEKQSESGEMEFSEPTCELPRDVRGILVYVKGNKTKRKIQWRTDDRLVDVRYIEIEEDERVNVFKVKSFEEMKKKEAMMEKTKMSSGFDLTEEEQDDSKAWRLIPLTFEEEHKEIVEKLLEIAGQDSMERKVQRVREASVLRALQLSGVPRDPSEPDQSSHERSGLEMRGIPLEDLSENRDESEFSYSDSPWPAPAGAVAPSLPSKLNNFLNNIPPSLINSLPPVTSLPTAPDLSKPPPIPGVQMSAEEQQLLAAQKAAAAALGFHPPPSHSNGFSNTYNRGGQGGQRPYHYQDRGFNGGFNRGHNNHNNHNNRDRFREGSRNDYNRRPYPHPSR